MQRISIRLRLQSVFILPNLNNMLVTVLPTSTRATLLLFTYLKSLTNFMFSYVCRCFARMCACVPCVCLVPQRPEDPRSSGRASSALTSLAPILPLNTRKGGWRDDSVIKNTYFSCREPGFNTQHQHWVAHKHRGSDTPF